jgi:mannose-1-phosphate guanylyltransferase/mannose-6-phosphate isomerase
MTVIQPVILSGGTGSRLWPLSRSQHPKQFQPLASDRSLLQETVERVQGRGFSAPAVICHADHRFLVAEQIRELALADSTILLEAAARSTAPAVAVAALMAQKRNPGALLLILPADHVIRDVAAFHEAIAAAKTAAMYGKLVTFGIVPTQPAQGYGYIRRGPALAESPRAFEVLQFVEKPNRAAAEQYLAAGDYFWNSGMFLFQADAYLAELARLEPDMLENCRAAITQGRQEEDYFWIAAAPFARCRAISIDYAVMERTAKAAVVPAQMGWSDIGSWESLWEVSSKDADGNVASGDVLQHGSHGSYLRSEGPLLAAVGLRDIAVIATKDAVLVCAKSASQDVKQIVERLERGERTQHLAHAVTVRPWGSYERLDAGNGFQVKHIIVKAGAKLSLQRHQKRAEHWTVVSGRAIVTCDDKVFPLGENQSTFIPLGTKHRLENPGTTPLHVIEVQYGGYLGEDDIVRFEDSYGR